MHQIKYIKVCGLTIFLLLMINLIPVFAGNHPLSRINATTVDLVVSLDWDLNNPPTVAGTVLDRTYITATMRTFAAATFQMTEGRHRLGRVYIFERSQNINRADMQFLHRVGRANAHTGGILNAGSRMQLFTLDSPNVLDPAIGRTMAHEFAHYVYDLLDEYREAGMFNTNDPGAPQDGDTPRNSIMNNHQQFSRFSTSTDYTDPTQRRTAQWRVFQSSNWETLVRDPRQDRRPAFFQNTPQRRQINVFQGVMAPTIFTNPTTGWENDFNLIFQNQNTTATPARLPYAATFVFNTGLSAQQIAASKAAAKRIFNQHARNNDRIAIIAFGDGNQAVDIQAPLTTISDANSRNQLNTIVNSINPTPAMATDLNAALQATLALYANPTAGESPVVLLITDNANTAPDVSAFRTSNIPIYVFALNTNQLVARSRPLPRNTGSLGNSVGGSGNKLGDIANLTGGQYIPIDQPSEMTKLFYEALNTAVGENIQVLNDQQKSIATGQNFELTTHLSSAENNIEFFASWQVDNTDIAYVLLTPEGIEINPNSLPAGVEYELSSEDGEAYAVYSIAAPASGNWKSKVTYSGTPDNALVFQEVSGESLLSANMAFIGGTDEQPGPIGLNVTVEGPLPVINAQVSADIFDSDNNAIASDISLLDDGEGVDSSANDGIYSVVLEGFLLNAPEAGDYEVCVTVRNEVGNDALFSTSGARIGLQGVKQQSSELSSDQKVEQASYSNAGQKGVQGVNAADEMVPPFQRFLFDYISLDAAPQPPTNTAIAQAIAVTADNHDEFGYLIENNAKLFYQLKTFTGNSYRIETSQLLSFDNNGQTLVSNMQLLDGAGNLLFDNIACHEDGQSFNTSCLEGTSPVDADFYISVNNSQPSFGFFALNVDQTGISASNSDRIFKWAEVNFSQFVNPAGQSSMTLAGYYFRFYPGSNSYLATFEGRVLYLASPTAQILDLGPADSWLAQAATAGF